MARILVLDSDCAVRSALQVLLQLEGFEVAVAENGSTAMQVLRGIRIDLVVLDLNLRGMHGYEVIEQIRAHASDLPIVAMSGLLFRDVTNPGEDVLARAVALGAAVALRKPFRPKELLDAIAAGLALRYQMNGAVTRRRRNPGASKRRDRRPRTARQTLPLGRD
jgi:CheY-like chemotaxis protein